MNKPGYLPPRFLNVGCGGSYRLGYVNLDLAHHDVADAHADASLLPFPDESFERIELIHVIEHLGYRGALNAVSEAFRLLVPGGRLVIETPDPEGAFRGFLDDDDQEQRAQLLTWMFGLDAPGYAHRLLYPAELLVEMVRSAGFGDPRFKPQRHHRYAPGRRMVTRRDGLPVHGVLADLRRAILVSGEPDLSLQLHALEFEQGFVGAVLALGGAAECPSDPEATALDNIFFSPAAAKTWLTLCASHGVDLPFDSDRLLNIANAAVEERLPDRMAALFERLCDTGTDADDGWENIRSQGLDALRHALDGPPGREPETIRDQLPPPLPGEGWIGQCPMCRPVFEARVLGMHDRAVRMLSLGREAQGVDLLERAARCRINPFYPLWNLAVAHAAGGRFEQAEDLYRKALGQAVPEIVPVLARELAVLLLHAGKSEARDELLKATGQAHAVDPPSLRTRPVLSGESYYHEPDPA